MKKNSIMLLIILFIIIIASITIFNNINKSTYSIDTDSASLIIPTYETNDTIIADYIISPAENSNTDMSNTIQNALNSCMNALGGTVLLKKGIYHVSNPITIPKSCTLRGDWQDPDNITNPE